MLKTSRRAWWVGGWWFCIALAALSFSAFADEPAAASSPPTDQVDALINQLGDVDFKTREAATDKLLAMGSAALPALKAAITSAGDPEICSRADALVRRLERPRVPADWLGPDGFGGGRAFGGTQVTTSNINGVRRVEVSDSTGRRRVSIVDGPSGIEMTVTGLEEGRPVTARFKARSADDLAAEDPDAYRVYQRWANVNTGPFVRGRRLIMPPPPVVFRPPADDLLALEARVQKQMKDANAAADQQRAVRDLFRELEQLQVEAQAVEPADWNKQIARYNALSDALRDKLEALKLPDPGDALPPPAKSRLGISVGPADPALLGPGADAGLTIHRIIPDSRGAKMGLKEGDVIRTVNGKAVADTGALRRAISESKDPLLVEVMRDAKPQTLREKPAK